MVIIVMGVIAAGKTTVGRALAARLGWRFLDADDFHSEENWRRLSRGEPLSDADRRPWLAALRDAVAELMARGESAVLACSALRQAYRDALVPAPAPRGAVRFVFLRAAPDLLAARLRERVGHRASAALLPSQLATLEEPTDALVLDAASSPEQLADEIVRALDLHATRSASGEPAGTDVARRTRMRSPSDPLGGMSDRWIAGEAVDDVRLGYNARVDVISGPHRGERGTVAGLLGTDPEPHFLVVPDSGGGDLRLPQSALRPAV